MVKVSILDGSYSVIDAAGQSSYVLDNSTKRVLTLESLETEYSLVLRGDFKLAASGSPESGEIETFTFITETEGAVIKIDMTDADVNFGKFYKHLTNGTLGEHIDLFMGGDDKITGSASHDDHLAGYGGDDRIIGKDGGDYIEGGDGNDRMTGGAELDLFRLYPGSGRDVITDFVASGDDKDFFIGDSNDVKAIVQSGQDTIVKFFGGDQVKLLGVDASEFTVEDYW